MQIILLVVLIVVLGLVLGRCPPKQRKQCGPVPQCKQTCNNIKLLSIKPLCKTTDCVEGCFCPPSAPIETFNSNSVMRCIASVDKCSCSRFQQFKMCSDVVTPTCNSPEVKNQPEQCGFPRCQCVKDRPIWHQGRCINEQKCTCPDLCAKAGCSVCNKCDCRFGKRVKCGTKKCPDILTSDGLQELIKNGCWRLSPSREQCIFYSPCLDPYGDVGCDSDIISSQGYKFCSECHKCECINKEEICKKDDNCEYLIRGRGCWTLVKEQCVFISPCPENSAKACQGLQPGIKMCKMCSKCECVHGVKICSKERICPDPNRHGCYIPRKYIFEEKRCYFVSPCPPNASPILSLQCPTFDVTESFCYLYNGQIDVCEFISPCPLITNCREGDTICKKCNECRCRNGEVRCSNYNCGDPIPNGCWVMRAKSCVFLSPCPNDVVLDGDKFCKTDSNGNFCRGCNFCHCTTEGFAICTQRACPRITEQMGCYLSIHGTCVFMAPCPTVA